MIIKGGSRASPKQLALLLLEAAPGESSQVLELQYGDDDLLKAFIDWQSISEGTLGKLGLYHAHINPDSRYAMTPQQWKRAADVLEEKLGLQGQWRALVLRSTEGRQRLHVVWSRTDIDTMMLRSDSFNYRAHEQASAQLALEFGHEIVPGKTWRGAKKK
ncbi:MAG TPA: hypothetical protein VN428_22915 [Bryobacteraceae bacterium]|nr:hypothetical protein [Bryobacteraceae bacterium]